MLQVAGFQRVVKCLPQLRRATEADDLIITEFLSRPIDLLGHVAKALPRDDRLAFSLAARSLNAARATAKLKLKTKPKALMHSSVALLIWARSIGCPLPRAWPGPRPLPGQPCSRRRPFVNQVFNHMHLMRGSTEALYMWELEDDLVPFTQEQLECVAWPESVIAFKDEEDEEDEDSEEDDQQLGPYIVDAPNGSYFTVADLIDAIAGLEDEDYCGDGGELTPRAFCYPLLAADSVSRTLCTGHVYFEGLEYTGEIKVLLLGDLDHTSVKVFMPLYGS